MLTARGDPTVKLISNSARIFLAHEINTKPPTKNEKTRPLAGNAIERLTRNMDKVIKPGVGLWIDHRKAVIVFVAGRETETKVISANIEKHHRQSGVSTPADDIRQRELTGQLNIFYDEVVSCIRDAESILILGPGEAKGELRKRLEKDNLSRRIVGIKTSDKMTDKQIVAVVRGHFNQKSQQRVRASPA